MSTRTTRYSAHLGYIYSWRMLHCRGFFQDPQESPDYGRIINDRHFKWVTCHSTMGRKPANAAPSSYPGFLLPHIAKWRETLGCTQSLSFLVHSNWETGASGRHSRAENGEEGRIRLPHSPRRDRLPCSLQSRARSHISVALVSQLLRERKGTACRDICLFICLFVRLGISSQPAEAFTELRNVCYCSRDVCLFICLFICLLICVRLCIPFQSTEASTELRNVCVWWRARQPRQVHRAHDSHRRPTRRCRHGLRGLSDTAEICIGRQFRWSAEICIWRHFRWSAEICIWRSFRWSAEVFIWRHIRWSAEICINVTSVGHWKYVLT